MEAVKLELHSFSIPILGVMNWNKAIVVLTLRKLFPVYIKWHDVWIAEPFGHILEDEYPFSLLPGM
jgi:hypothetical protein